MPFLDFHGSGRQLGTVKAPASVTTPEEYLAWVPGERRAALTTLHQLILREAPALEPRIIAGMIGYGISPHRERLTVGLANQKQNMSLYFCATEDGRYLAESWQDRLGKVSVGKSCVRFKKLSDLDLQAVEALVKRTAALGRFSGT